MNTCNMDDYQRRLVCPNASSSLLCVCIFFLRGTGLRHFALGSLLGPGNFVCYIESVIHL